MSTAFLAFCELGILLAGGFPFGGGAIGVGIKKFSGCQPSFYECIKAATQLHSPKSNNFLSYATKQEQSQHKLSIWGVELK